MRKVISWLLMILGGILLVCALLYTLGNFRDARQARKASQEDLQAVQQVIPSTEPTETVAEERKEETVEVTTEPTHPEVMAEETVNGRVYIGYLSIPDLDLELPVMSQWSYPNLRVSPCRHQGTTWGNDLVIAAHNYPSHFGRLHTLEEGAPVTFTDMEGNVNKYTVGIVESVEPYDEDHVLESDWDLVLYTCTPGGHMRVMAGLQRAVETQPEVPAEH